jgi:lipooligosaccharide transport system permease protein
MSRVDTAEQEDTLPSGAPLPDSRRPLPSLYSGNIGAVLGRGLLATKSSSWGVVVSGFVEPVLYLLAMGIGLGSMIGSLPGPGGTTISYGAYIAPALLAVAAMNGAVFDSTWSVFFKLNMAKLYRVMLNTSLGPIDVAAGEISLALLRGAVYAAGFTIVMVTLGFVSATWAVLMIPSAVLIAFGFASFGMGITSFMTTFQQMDWIEFVMLPMFLFSATFYPIDVYPGWVQTIIEVLPLWHGVELLRSISQGVFDLALLGHLAYYVGMIVAGMVLTTTRLKALFLK